jgi:hypothetical protein
VKFVAMQDDYPCIFCVVDLHAITVPQDPKLLAAQTREIASAYLAAGAAFVGIGGKLVDEAKLASGDKAAILAAARAAIGA